jgi:DNA-binding GntR family transcriptional regulator
MSDLDFGPAIEPISIREQVYNRIRHLIVSGRIPRATRMTENQLAKQLGVSRTPVREALQVLESEGFLDAVPRSGYEVKMLLPEEMEGICEIRKVIESLAARWAIQNITPEELRQLEENVAMTDEALQRGEPQYFVKGDVAFHEILARASRSRQLLEISQILRRQMLPYRVGSVSNNESFLGAVAGHQRILERIQARDTAGAEQAVQEHIDYVKEEAKSMLAKILQKQERA